MAALCKRILLRSSSLPCSEDGSTSFWKTWMYVSEVGSTGLSSVVLKNTNNPKIKKQDGPDLSICLPLLFSFQPLLWNQQFKESISRGSIWTMVNVEIISQDWCSWTNAIGEVLCQSMPRIQLLLSFKLVSTTLSFESRHFPRSHFQDFLFLQDEEFSVKLPQVSLIHVQYIHRSLTTNWPD